MKKFLIALIALAGLTSCSKDSEYIASSFPGVTGRGDDAIWVVLSHTVSDRPYVTSALLLQTPPISFGRFDSSYVQARQREVTPYSYRFYKGGEFGLIGKGPANENIWVKQTNLKWEDQNSQVMLYQNTGGNWVNIAVGFRDQDNLLFRYRKSYFGDNSADKDRFVMEVLYSFFK